MAARRADELGRDRALTLADVAQLTGFASASALSHAYHAAPGARPGRRVPARLTAILLAQRAGRRRYCMQCTRREDW